MELSQTIICNEFLHSTWAPYPLSSSVYSLGKWWDLGWVMRLNPTPELHNWLLPCPSLLLGLKHGLTDSSQSITRIYAGVEHQTIASDRWFILGLQSVSQRILVGSARWDWVIKWNIQNKMLIFFIPILSITVGKPLFNMAEYLDENSTRAKTECQIFFFAGSLEKCLNINTTPLGINIPHSSSLYPG